MNADETKTLPRFLRFATSSLLCTAVDQTIAGTLFSLLRGFMPGADLLRILVASTVARVVSVALNLSLNRRLVFTTSSDAKTRKATRRFFGLAVFVLALSTFSVWWLHTVLGVSEWMAKPVVDLALFFVNYNGQRLWVFGEDAKRPVFAYER